ncbi:MAG: DUF1570 domain-containing protein [Planctomycetes bacterium]|nr:DUF1570 domain-containing protein [Planctomycetota bacterium]
MRRRPIGWAAGFVLAAGAAAALSVLLPAAAAAAAGWPMKAEGEFIVAETPHYLIRTDLGADIAQLIASHQEALFQDLYRRMAGNKPGAFTLQRVTVLIVSSKEKYEALAGQDVKGSQGQYQAGRNLISGYGSKDQIDDLLEVLRHESTHQFVQQFIGPKCPVWLNEGLAEFFKHAQFKGGQLATGQAPTYLVNDLKRVLAENRLFPVQKMLSMTPEAWMTTMRGGGPEAYVEYQQSWVMVHFLQAADDGKYRAPFLQFMYYLARGRDGPDAWQKSFGGDVAGFEKRLHEYIKTLKPTGGLGCRWNLALIAHMLLSMQRSTGLDKDMATFRQAVLGGQLGGWTLTMGSGLKISSDDTDTLKSLFRCPDDTTSKPDEPSYELVPGKPGEPPAVRCRHHAGYVLETVYEKDAEGRVGPKIVARAPGSVPPPPKPAPAAKTAPASPGAKKP